MKRVLVCGGRNYYDRDILNLVLFEVVGLNDLVITGGARGADALAFGWATENGRSNCVFPANWSLYRKSAGPRRNADMIRHGQPDLVVAFPGGPGTANMVKQAREAGIDVREVPE